MAMVAPSSARALPQASQQGTWSQVYDWDCQLNPNGCQPGTDYGEISHAALLPVGIHAGKVLHWRRSLNAACQPLPTTEVWLFSAESPGQLLKNEQDLQSDIFCGAMSFDRYGRLTVAGGFPYGSTTAPTETYRFDPRLLQVPIYPLPPPSCPTPIVKGAPWSSAFHMSGGRYYGSLISLDRRPITSSCSSFSIPGGAQAILGGPPLLGNGGNELWQFQNPAIRPGPTSNPWLHTLDSPAGTGSQTPSGPAEIYAISATHPPGDVRLDSYPRPFQLADVNDATALGGQIFVAFDVDTVAGGCPPNPSGSSWVQKPPRANVSGCWELAGGQNSGAPPIGPVSERSYAPAVLLHTLAFPEGRNRVLGFGGREWSQPCPSASSTVHGNVQEYRAGTSPQGGQWQPKAAILPRVNHNAVILPTGHIFVVGGASSAAQGSWQLTPQLYDPGASPTALGMAYSMAPNSTPRLYHSVAVLLLDGTVLVMGGAQRPGAPASEYTGEVYSPPYLFNGTRPVIESAPGTIEFSPPTGTFSIGITAYHHHIERVVLLRPAAVTHHCDYDQRSIELAFTAPAGYESGSSITLTVTRPNETLGPPGYYTLWVVESKTASTMPAYTDLIPSQGRIVLLN